MSPALLINETSAPASPETAENTASPSPTSEPLTLDGPSPATTSRLNRRSPLLRRSVRTPALWLEEAEGSWLTVTDGVKKWKIFDASGGASVSNIGYKDSRVYAATRKQEDTGIQYAASMTFNTHAPYDFADLLLESTGDEMREVVFFGSGSEALEASQKLSYQYHSRLKQNPEPQRHWFIARDRSYHGATFGALELSGHKGRKDMYRPILPNNTHFISPCNEYRGLNDDETRDQYVERLAEELENMILELGSDTVAGFYMEPVVGAALGCAPALPGYLTAMKRVCRKYGVLLIFDEVMCGMGRTGRMHAWQEEGVVPDIQLLGKGLAGGYANLSAMLAGPLIVDALGDGAFAHGHTFQNFPAGCAAGLAVQRVVRDDNLLANVCDKGEKLMKKLMARLGDHPYVGNIRGPGLFKGLEFVQDRKTKMPFHPDLAVAWSIHELGLKDGYNIYVYPGAGTVDGDRGDHIIISPAYNITDEDIDFIVDRLGKLIIDFFEGLKPSLE